MTQTLTPAGFTQDTFDHFLASRDEPSWLIDQRREAWAAFQRQELPSQKEEEWMRTDIRLFKLNRFGMPAEIEGACAATPLLSEGVELGGAGSSINGLPCGIELDPRWASKRGSP